MFNNSKRGATYTKGSIEKGNKLKTLAGSTDFLKEKPGKNLQINEENTPLKSNNTNSCLENTNVKTVKRNINDVKGESNIAKRKNNNNVNNPLKKIEDVSGKGNRLAEQRQEDYLREEEEEKGFYGKEDQENIKSRSHKKQEEYEDDEELDFVNSIDWANSKADIKCEYWMMLKMFIDRLDIKNEIILNNRGLIKKIETTEKAIDDLYSQDGTISSEEKAGKQREILENFKNFLSLMNSEKKKKKPKVSEKKATSSKFIAPKSKRIDSNVSPNIRADFHFDNRTKSLPQIFHNEALLTLENKKKPDGNYFFDRYLSKRAQKSKILKFNLI